jgi:hypothetical protein
MSNEYLLHIINIDRKMISPYKTKSNFVRILRDKYSWS